MSRSIGDWVGLFLYTFGMIPSRQKKWNLGVWILRYTSGQTNRQTDTLITILRTPTGGEVTVSLYIYRTNGLTDGRCAQQNKWLLDGRHCRMGTGLCGPRISGALRQDSRPKWYKSNKDVGLLYCRVEMYALLTRLMLPLVSQLSMSTGQTDRRTDARPLHYAFR